MRIGRGGRGWGLAYSALREGGRPQSASSPSQPASTFGVLAATMTLAVAACSSGVETPRRDASLGVPSSPRDVAAGSIPKGGGVYKVGNPYQVGGRWYVPRVDPAYDRSGIASWYGADFHGRRTANGEIFDMNALTAAHTTLPLPSYVTVTNLENGRTMLVRVNDRGPYVGDRIIDLSRATATALGCVNAGLCRVRVKYAGAAPLDGNDRRERQYLAEQPWSGAARYAASEPPRVPAQPLRQTRDDAWSPFAHRSGLGAR